MLLDYSSVEEPSYCWSAPTPTVKAQKFEIALIISLETLGWGRVKSQPKVFINVPNVKTLSAKYLCDNCVNRK